MLSFYSFLVKPHLPFQLHGKQFCNAVQDKKSNTQNLWCHKSKSNGQLVGGEYFGVRKGLSRKPMHQLSRQVQGQVKMKRPVTGCAWVDIFGVRPGEIDQRFTFDKLS